MKRILIIEDDREMREALQSTLEMEEYTIDTAENAEGGLKILTEHMPDLIILDVMTGALHASGFLEKLRSLPNGTRTRVIVLTNLDSDETKEKIMAYNIDAFLIKVHTSFEALTEKVRSLLGG